MTFLHPLSIIKIFTSKIDKQFMLQSVQHDIKTPFTHNSLKAETDVPWSRNDYLKIEVTVE